MTITAPPVTPAVIDEPQRRFIGVVRVLRAEAQSLRQSLEDLQAIQQLPDASAREAALRVALRDAAPVFRTTQDHIGQLVAAAGELMDSDARLFASLGDELAHMRNAWERASLIWPGPVADTQPVDAAEVSRRTGIAARHLDELIYHAALVTVPDRLGEHLDQLRIGSTLNFDETFSDELPNAEQRARLLRYVNAHPRSISGIVDVRRGVIYRAARGGGRRLLSYAAELVVVLGGFGLVYLLTHAGSLLDLSQWPIGADRTAELTAAYIFLLLGALAHYLVDALKQARAANRPSFLALSNLLLWAHVKESTIVGAVLYLWLGLIGVAFAFETAPWQTAFFVGYSIDSFVDLFLQRFGGTATASAEAIKGPVR
jgi:hypothetical protein